MSLTKDDVVKALVKETGCQLNQSVEMIEEKKVGVFHEGTEVFIKEQYTNKNGNNLIHIRKIGTAIEIWTHMAAVGCR